MWTTFWFATLCMVATGHVVIEITVLQYDNPLGTSYSHDNIDGNRKCCDTGTGSDCAGKSDTCDVYFSFCVGRTPVATGSCNGTSIDMSQNVSKDVDYIGNGNNGGLTRVTRLPWWRMNISSLLVDVLDIDEISNDSQQPTIVPDQIDTFNTPLPLMPAKDYLSAPAHLISLTNHVSVDLSIRLWCDEGRYGDRCEHSCVADQYHECRGHPRRTAEQCTDPDVLVFSFDGSIESRNIRSVINRLPRFVADRVCPPDTQFVNVTTENVIQDSSKRQLEVVFRASCDQMTVSMLKLRQMVFSLEHVLTRLGTPEDFLGLPLVMSTINIAGGGNQPPKGTVIFLMRVIHYQGCDGCELLLEASNTTVWRWTFSTSQDVRDCNGNLIDVQSQGPHTTHAWSTTLVKVPTFPAGITGSVKMKNQTVAVHTFLTNNIPVGRNFYDAYSYRFNTSSVNGTVLRLEVIAWCGNCFHGNRCNVSDNDVNCNPDAPKLEPECSDNPSCLNGGTCTYHEVCSCRGSWLGRKCQADVDECTSGVCEHGQSCVNTPGDYTCTCKPGFTGHNCETDINECSSNPCDSKHFCLNTFGSFKCVCRDFLQSSNCAKPNPCNVNPCLNDGTCIVVGDTFRCACLPGWTDPLCNEDINECQNNSVCSNHGQCLNTKGGYSCNCSVAWQGTNCEVAADECKNASVCSHHGTCSMDGNTVLCNCSRGWQGQRCDIDVNECRQLPCQNNGTCHNTDGGYNCACSTGWKGINCTSDVDECMINTSCLNAATCVNTQGSFHCVCVSGWSGSSCSVPVRYCDDNPCRNSGTCVDFQGGYNCSCTSDWQGQNCTERINFCKSQNSPCQNGATCHSMTDGYRCACPAGWTGTNCTHDVNECLSKACAQGAQCVNVPGSYSCTCGSGWTGQNCSNDVDECDQPNICPSNETCVNLPGDFNCTVNKPCNEPDCTFIDCRSLSLCKNGGTCLNDSTGYHCACSTFYSGKHCETDIDKCKNRQSLCHNGGSCLNANDSFSCVCQKQWTGPFCDVNLECQSNYCENNGTCISTTDNYTCVCSSGWSGQNCSTNINECVTYPDICDHGDCVDTQGSFRCVCIQGFSGQNCSTDIDECLLGTICENNGICENNQGGYNCSCNVGWTGTNCSQDINECLAVDVCNGRGSCTNTQGNFSCTCNKGWDGRNCSMVDHCSTYPCRNGSTCINTADGYRCQCPSGWTGKSCNSPVWDCSTVHCLNGGTCRNNSGNVTCECILGYTGFKCETILDDCTTSICENGGTCHEIPGNFTCSCLSGWRGLRCNIDVNECTKYPCNGTNQCINTPGSYMCNPPSISSQPTVSPRNPTTTGRTKAIVVDKFSLEFTSPVTGSRLTSVQKGIEKSLRYKLCKNAKSVLVTIVRGDNISPKSVEFSAKCDDRSLTRSDISEAFHDIPESQLNSFFPGNLPATMSTKPKANKKTWLADHVTLMACSAVGTVVLVAIIVGSAIAFKRSRKNKNLNPDINMDSRMIIDDMDVLHDATFGQNTRTYNH